MGWSEPSAVMFAWDEWLLLPVPSDRASVLSEVQPTRRAQDFPTWPASSQPGTPGLITLSCLYIWVWPLTVGGGEGRDCFVCRSRFFPTAQHGLDAESRLAAAPGSQGPCEVISGITPKLRKHSSALKMMRWDTG